MYYTTFHIGNYIGRVRENMYSDQMSSAEAQAALATIEKAESETIASLRPPLWLITMISLLCGIFTFSFAVTAGENHWALAAWLSGIAVVLLVLFWMYSARLLGVRAPVLPPSGSGKIFLALQALFYAVVLFVGRGATLWGRPETRLEGDFPIADLPLAPYIAAVIVSLSVAYLTYKYPTNEWVQQDASK
ncbi:MAG TPA: hypothetical protein DCY33_04295 [Gemmatimonadetes bacterium]|nr:hypothetical protein [Gemmatimonadota bacterium]